MGDGPLDPRSWIDRSAAIEPSIARPLSLHLARRVGRTRQGAGRLRQPVMLLASPGLGPAPNLPGVRDSFTDRARAIETIRFVTDGQRYPRGRAWE